MGQKQILFYVLNKITLVDKLLLELYNAGLSGATVLNSIGMSNHAHSHEDNHVISSFRAFLHCHREENKTIFVILNNDEELQKAREVIRRVVGDLNQPHAGVFFTVPALYIEGNDN
ncbi:MAG: hypothetical protein IJW78_01940 [Clostridia bacterium]|nr:hypothetical protein [Clostridia bacterium]